MRSTGPLTPRVGPSALGSRPRAMARGAASTMPSTVERPVVEEVPVEDRPWVVIVWDDPINLMSYVTYVLQKLFGYPKEKAERLMLQVHHEGRAVVSSGTRERCELDVFRLHEHGLWATMAHDE
jgi:ATP-dependent Clp protease adaptor protein ClpS